MVRTVLRSPARHGSGQRHLRARGRTERAAQGGRALRRARRGIRHGRPPSRRSFSSRHRRPRPPCRRDGGATGSGERTRDAGRYVAHARPSVGRRIASNRWRQGASGNRERRACGARADRRRTRRSEGVRTGHGAAFRGTPHARLAHAPGDRGRRVGYALSTDRGRSHGRGVQARSPRTLASGRRKFHPARCLHSSARKRVLSCRWASG